MREIILEVKSAHSDVPWNAMYGLKNRIVHDYGSVDLNVVYEAPIYRDIL